MKNLNLGVMKNTVYNLAVLGAKYALLTELSDTLRAFRGK